MAYKTGKQEKRVQITEKRIMFNALHENRSNALVSTETACDMNVHKYKQIPVRVSTKNRTAMVI